MFPKRLTRTLASFGLGTSLILGMLAVPTVVLAGVPNWEASVQALPTAVTPGADAGYSVTIFNPGPSNISQLYFYADGAPNPTYSAPSQGSCTNPTGSLFCSLGALRAGDSATIVSAFPTPTSGSTFSVNFFFNTTGLGSGGGDNSHGDELPAVGTTSLNSDPNFAGRFVRDSLTVANGPISGAGNQQSTAVFSPAANIAVTAADGSAVMNNPACPTGLTCVLETSQIQVGDGSAQYGLFKVVIRIDKTALKGLSVKSLDVVHLFDDTTPPQQLGPCPKTGPITSDCATVSSIPGGHAEATIWLSRNGYVKFH